jgi:hypothetical protein
MHVLASWPNMHGLPLCVEQPPKPMPQQSCLFISPHGSYHHACLQQIRISEASEVHIHVCNSLELARHQRFTSMSATH